jgi:hypothetical protein
MRNDDQNYGQYPPYMMQQYFGPGFDPRYGMMPPPMQYMQYGMPF